MTTRASRSLRRHPARWTLAAAVAVGTAVAVPISQFLEQQQLRAAAAEDRAIAQELRLLREQDAMNMRAAKERADINQKVLDLQRDLLRIVGELSQAYLDKDRDQKKIDQLRGQARSKQGEIDGLEAKNVESTKTIDDLGNKLGDSLDKQARLQSTLTAMSTDYALATDANFHLSDANFELTDANRHLNDAVFALEDHLDDASIRISELTKVEESLRETVAGLERSNVALVNPEALRAIERLQGAFARELPTLNSGDPNRDTRIREIASSVRPQLEELHGLLEAAKGGN